MQIGASLAAMTRDHGADQVAGFEESIDVRVDQPDLVFADAIKQRLEHMGETRDVIEAEHAGATLDRVGGTEDSVEIVLGRDRDVHAHQQAFHAGKVFGSLLEEDLLELADVDAHDRAVSENNLPSADTTPNDFQQLGWIERLDQPAGGAGRFALRLHGIAGLGGEQQDRRAGMRGSGAQRAHHGQAIHLRHVLIRDDELDAVGLRHR